MKKLPEATVRINVNLFKADLERLRALYGAGGYNRVIRALVRLHLQQIAANLEVTANVGATLGLGALPEKPKGDDEGTEGGSNQRPPTEASPVGKRTGQRKKGREKGSV